MIFIFLFILGAISGSFVVASVWRLRAEQLADEKKYSKLIKKHKLNSVKPKQDYSRCLSCGHRLKCYDLIPIISWLLLRGKCRYCNKKIGWIELLTEVVLAIVFILSYICLYDVLTIWQFCLWIGMLIVLAVLSVYDYRYLVMPSKILYLFIGMAVVYFVLTIKSVNWQVNWFEYGLAIFILSGIYALLWLVSKGRWVGSGDGYLGFGLALILADWKLAMVSLFLANLIGVFLVLPDLIFRKKTTNSKIALGPLLITGFLIAFFAQSLIKNYFYYFY